MPEVTFIASALLGVPLAISFLVVGAKLHRRSRLEGRATLMFFASFWIGIGAYAFVEAAWSLAFLAGIASMPLALLVLHVKTIGTVVAFAGLVSYILAIRAADARVRGVVVGAYGVVLALTSTFYSWRDPVAQQPHAWGMRLVYANNSVEPWWTLLLFVLFLPPFLATVSYALLLRHTSEPELRYRIALTSASLLAFFAPLFLGWRAGNLPWWGAIEKGLAIVMATGMILALWPTPAIRAWIERDGGAHHDDALVRRAHDLI